MRHPALEQPPFEPLTAAGALAYRPLIVAALAEDGADHDITSEALVSAREMAAANVAFRSPGVVAGLELVGLTFHCVDEQIHWTTDQADGARVASASVVARANGSARSLLAGERVALNLLGRLSGIATLTRAFVEAVAGLPARICDTRKTTPGLRALERYAVRAGGGYNHRFGLRDAVLIKDNHLAVIGDVANAVQQARKAARDAVIEVECETLSQVEAALEAQPDAILLDNMSLDDLRRAVEIGHGKAVLEASGGVMLGNVREIARTGVDVISVGALTHGVRSLDVGLDFSVAAVSAEAK